MLVHNSAQYYTRAYYRKLTYIWEFPKIRGSLFSGLYTKDPTI